MPLLDEINLEEKIHQDLFLSHVNLPGFVQLLSDRRILVIGFDQCVNLILEILRTAVRVEVAPLIQNIDLEIVLPDDLNQFSDGLMEFTVLLVIRDQVFHDPMAVGVDFFVF